MQDNRRDKNQDSALGTIVGSERSLKDTNLDSNTETLPNKPKVKFLLFNLDLAAAGGAERLLLEEAQYIEKNGMDAHILTFLFKDDVLFNETYKANVKQLGSLPKKSVVPRVLQKLSNVLALRKEIRRINPDIIISASAASCIPLYYATLFTPFSYVTHIHGTIFWFHDNLSKYALVHRKVFKEIRESVVGHKEFISPRLPKCSPIHRILLEADAIQMYLAVRAAKKIFVLSNQMKWEVSKLYGKDALVLKGAFPPEILTYQPEQNVKEHLGLSGKKVILNVNRLDPRKRVNLLIKAFKQVSNEFNDAILVIGGKGPEEANLRRLAKELDIEGKVRFEGYIREEHLWDYVASCDVFAHPNWADFAISACEALALQKKVVWSTEMEIDEILSKNDHIFPAYPTVNDFAETMKKALNTDVKEDNDLSAYTWDNYFRTLLGSIESNKNS